MCNLSLLSELIAKNVRPVNIHIVIFHVYHKIAIIR